MAKRKYQYCATCIHFLVKKEQSKTTYQCKRLGYETKPYYTFNCWTPKQNVVELMRKRGDQP